MASSTYKNYRVASFVGVNSGEIVGCSANVLFKAKYHGSGFVYDNDGFIRNSVSVRSVQGDGKLGGFYYRNNGRIDNCGWIGKLASKDKQNARRYQDEELCISPDTETPEVYSRLGLSSFWRNNKDDKLEPDFKLNRVELGSAEYIAISDADQLLELIEAINDGDRAAAGGNYILTENINLRGKKIDPIGASESTPFTGVFDGNGHSVYNFSIRGKNREFSGFFGVTRGARVVNLKLDYLHKGAGSTVSGGMVGSCIGGSFENCVVYTTLNPGRCAGGFVGKNSGKIINCLVAGKVRFIIPLWILLGLLGIPLLCLLLLLGWAALRDRDGTTQDDPYVPEIIDPNQRPVVNPNPVPPPPAGTNRISFEMNQKVYISASTMVGYLGYVNPARATMDVVVRICISDSELNKAGYSLVDLGLRTKDEIIAPDYNPDTAMTELYRSGRLQIGYALDNCKLKRLPDGSGLRVGTYEMIVMIDGYNPESNEKSIINTQVPITVDVVE